MLFLGENMAMECVCMTFKLSKAYSGPRRVYHHLIIMQLKAPTLALVGRKSPDIDPCGTPVV